MKHHIALAFSLALSAGFLAHPVQAEKAEKSGEIEEGMDLLSQGARLFLRGLVQEMGPALAEMEEALGNLGAYHPPEILPNGDIIIRRKTTPPVVPDLQKAPEGEIEL